MILDIVEVAKKAGIEEKHLELYGRDKAKILSSISEKADGRHDGKLILVTAITPTKAGEGKTTTSIALAEGFGEMRQNAILCLREPALGPVFGIKGGATGAGKASIYPAEDINLHFTGDMHALTSSINLISAMIDNELFHGTLDLDIDPERVVWKRAMDMNDRALREIDVANGPKNGVPRKDGFIITVASELMAIMCLAKDENDFYERLRSIVVAYTRAGKEVTVADLKCSHAVMRLMKKALRPNLAQTLYGDPVFIHGGPFANIAHGCNSLIATKLALKLSPLVITEAGFAADLGAEKFLDIATREGGFKPNLVVVVATIRALKLHGGVKFEDLDKPNVEAMMKGIPNLLVHLENIRKFGMDSIVAINHFVTDAPEETASLEDFLREKNIRFAFVDAYERGAKGGVGLAHKVIEALGANRSSYHPLYDLERPLKEKIETIAKEIYRADGVEYSELAEKQLADYEARGYGNFYVCMAKTPNSLSDDPKLLGVPEHHIVHIREVELAKGARFVIPLAGNILRMPGLPKVPAAIKMEDEPW